MSKILKGSENFRVMNHFLNIGQLAAAEACVIGVSNNLKSRVSALKSKGFDIESKRVPKKAYHIYSIPCEKIEENRRKLSEMLHGK